MSKRRKKKGIIAIVAILIIACLILYLILFHFGSDSSKVVDEVEKYGYTLDNRDTELMKEIFNNLKTELSNSKINYEKYAEQLSKYFIVDLYTIDNKLNKYDVGGSDCIHPDHVTNYQLKVSDTLYRYLEESSSRKTKMPEVSKINVDDITSDSYKYGENEYDAYKVNLSWEYKEELGYDDSGIVTLMKIEDKLYVAEYTTEVSQ
ncbi:MAG: hypothetical protein E7167_02765 [Firmicutes bacterium]|nr:hypothetical protein [Bacillota bacterium]